MNRQLVSRRRFVRQCGGLAISPLFARLAAGQNSPPPASERTARRLLEIALLKPFEGVQLLAISPDSTHICLYAFRHLETFLRPWSYDGGKAKRIDDTLRVIDLRTGDLVYATQLRSMVVNASFFADGGRLYAETMPMVEREGGRATVFQQAVIDLETRTLDQRLCPLGSSYVALSGSSLLGHEFSLQTSQPTSLIIAALPDYRIGVRTPFTVAQEPEHRGRPVITGGGMVYGHDTEPVVSSDRETIVYGTGHSIVCRNTNDLGVRWTHPVEPDYLGAWMLDLTPDGSRVAAAIVGGSSVADRDKFYVGVYDGKDGSVMTRLALNGREGVAISPDGELLAISQQIALRDGRVEPAVNIFEIASGSQVGKVGHQATIVSGFGNSGKGAIGSRFTPDGKYLITSGVSDTMVWAIQR